MIIFKILTSPFTTPQLYNIIRNNANKILNDNYT